ncbi:hypothetical protein PIB30_088392 [Stylosanthes scabra]|uniref:Uncharacterized protein n=1 Tax=Stylosanthes scabra TaxID=79078 RepID=A0ABU6SU01_9FABA|nr:hypothetical protein [Stylosanthes scabra]
MTRIGRVYDDVESPAHDEASLQQEDESGGLELEEGGDYEDFPPGWSTGGHEANTDDGLGAFLSGPYFSSLP